MRYVGGGGYWIISKPEGYRGKRHVGYNFLYEHRYLMEEKLGRYLEYNEIIHHINGDKLDNRIENLMVLSRSKHGEFNTKPPNIKCDICKKYFHKRPSKIYKTNFCSRQCMGKYWGRINGLIKKKKDD